jgi:protein SCO1/2
MRFAARRVVFYVALIILGGAAASRVPLVSAACPEDHRTQQQALAAARYERSVVKYTVPDVTLVNQREERVSLRALLAPESGVALNFVFATCSTICPVMTATFARMRDDLARETDELRIVSISIDPDHDTPSVLRDYANRFGSGPEWAFLTGDGAEIVRVLKAFDAYAGSKTNHQPLSFLRAPGRGEWVRIKGFASAAELAGEYRQLRGY